MHINKKTQKKPIKRKSSYTNIKYGSDFALLVKN